ncbi:MAG: hypothetical protein CBC13_03440 [Planctomycetia bacterium TMED53]|nr:MAG: hypothetical protein CBC13_03440 [Planctomycetia bacterium TMED53]
MISVPQSLELIVFDLDGTLIDSIGDIASAVNQFRSSRGRDHHSEEVVRAAVGHGARYLCKELLTDLAHTDESPEALYQEFRKIYIAEASHPDHRISWLPGAHRALDHLQTLGLTAAILTNKPQKVTAVLQPQLFNAFPWSHIHCPEDALAPKPNPSGLKNLIELNRTTPQKTMLVGDSAVDFSTGKSAQVFTVGLRGGYGQTTPPEPDHWIDALTDLIPLLNDLSREEK